ncbi:hypothetical protein FPQ14_11550 [Gilliamella apicola]|uniref:Uncharacterized protein n=1 Tax=Gilliamella apicola TaxID=1196095 RepID=A0A556RGG1_9GAMM|nr:hypothetical protein [Gilliamella apicola]TSJ87970.1 hypothetical protein FPQ14_11550 [Gilliamella apicola]
MSLEQAVMQNTEMLIKIYEVLKTKADNELSASLKETLPVTPESVVKPAEPTKKAPEPEVKKEKVKVEAKKEAQAPKEPTPQPVPAVQEAIRVLLELAKTNRPAAVEVLNKYNVKKAPDVPENQRADFVNDIMSKLDKKG